MNDDDDVTYKKNRAHVFSMNHKWWHVPAGMTHGLVYRIRDDVNNATGAVDPVTMTHHYDLSL